MIHRCGNPALQFRGWELARPVDAGTSANGQVSRVNLFNNGGVVRTTGWGGSGEVQDYKLSTGPGYSCVGEICMMSHGTPDQQEGGLAQSLLVRTGPM